MKLRNFLSAMLVTALATSTAVFADDITTQSGLDINLTVENGKGTYTLTDEENEAFVDYLNEVHGYGEDGTLVKGFMRIFGEDSSFTIADGKSFSLNEVYAVDFDFIDVEKDANGSTTFTCLRKDVHTRLPMAVATAIWGPGSKEDGNGDPDAVNTFTDTTLTVAELIDCIGDEYSYSGWGYNLDEDEWGREFYYEDVDIVAINFHTNDVFDDNGYVKDPYYRNSNGIGYVQDPESNPHCYSTWLLTEQGAEILNGANGGSSAPETTTAPEATTVPEDTTAPEATNAPETTEAPEATTAPEATEAPETTEAPDYELDVKEALKADDMADIISKNAEADVVIKADNGVCFKFTKGTMTTVDGVDAYDFASTISTDLSTADNDKLTEDNFVLSISYAYSGKLPAKAEITIPVGKEYAGKTLYYNKVLENGIKLICAREVDENGFITVTQDSCSDYLLTTEDISTEKAENEDKPNTDTGVEGVAVVVGVAVVAGAAIIISRKKK